MKAVKTLSVLLFLVIAVNLSAQHVKISIGLRSQEVLQNIQDYGTYVEPQFTDEDVTHIFTNYTIYSMKKTYPSSRFPHMHRYYTVECNSAELVNDLNNLNSSEVPYAELEPEIVFTYTPNDYGISCNGNARDLDLIRAKEAWDVTHGNPNIVIGVTDTGFDTTVSDLQGKIDTIRSNTTNTAHGTLVASIVAANTNNNSGIAAIGFNCRLDLARSSDDNMLQMSREGRKVLNASWHSPPCTYNNNYNPQSWRSGWLAVQKKYDEIYENGAIACFGVGNGRPQDCYSDGVTYPSSLDHNISVSSVGSNIPYGQKSWWYGLPDSIYWNMKDVHENVVGLMDSTNTYQLEVHNHNSRVDIVAPGYTVSGITHGDTLICEGGWGTSFASPLVAGTCGLMLSANPYLTPYQMEWILKNTAHNIYTIPENVQYTGKLGAGRLDAGAAVSMASQYDVNSIYTQTMHIKGVEFNTICRPGLSSNSVDPQLKPIIENGTPPYTYKWEADQLDNRATLSATNVANPTVTSSSATHRLHYNLRVYDSSPVQQVASKDIQIDLIDSAKYNFGMRDSYMDMGNEPNTQMTIDPREWNIWQSQDIWNRQQQDGDTVPQNAEYFNTDSNYAYVRVRNIGCIPTPDTTAKLRIYWTKASTGEDWDEDWTTTNYTNPQTNNTFPAGREITQTPISIPVIQPGDQIIFNCGWRPVSPESYDTTANAVDVCLLARIEESPNSPYGMTFPESTPNSPVKPHIINNNNIVTRNMSVVNFDPANKKDESVHHILTGNVNPNADQSFDLELINERMINPHFSGDLSQVVEIEVGLGVLFERWDNTGRQGTYSSVNTHKKSVKFDVNSKMFLKDILVYRGERAGITITFKLKDGKESEIPHTVHFRQWTRTETPQIYGSVSFQIPAIIEESSKKENEKEKSGNIIHDNLYAIYPNPTSDKISIQYLSNANDFIATTLYDINGRVIIEKPMKEVSQYQIETLDVSKFASGLYTIEIRNNKGEVKHYKFFKK